MWFFAGYTYLRDSDSQPGTDPRFPRASEQRKVLGKLTWRLARGWQLAQSLHHERWVAPEPPTIAKPFESTVRFNGSVPAVTFGHLTHTASGNTVWDLRVGRFLFSQNDDPTTDKAGTPSLFNQGTRRWSGAPAQIGSLKGARTTAKSTISHHRAGLLGAAHDLKVGLQFEGGDHRSLRVIPTGARFVVDTAGFPLQAISSAPSNAGGRSSAVGAFLHDAVALGNRMTITAGLRFDRSRAISQDLRVLDLEGHDTGDVASGLGPLYTWNVWSPRVGMTARLTADGRTLLRASYGRYSQGVLTGELSPLHPGVTPVITRDFVAADRDYTRTRQTVDRSNLQLDPDTRPPRTDEYSVALERELGRRLAASVVYVHKDGADFIGWTDVGGRYGEEIWTLEDGRRVPVFVLAADSPVRRYQLTNPADYATTYDGLVMTLDSRRSRGWQARGSYTLSRATGLQPSSGTTAAGAQISTVGSPPVFFGRDPNDLSNAYGRLPNDRPHMLRAAGSTTVPGTGVALAASLQYFSGKPWAASTLIALPPPQSRQQRVLLESRGTRRLTSQTLLDVRLSKTLGAANRRIELILDVLNALNTSAEEGLITDDLFGRDDSGQLTWGKPAVFVDPRRAMLSVRLTLGR